MPTPDRDPVAAEAAADWREWRDYHPHPDPADVAEDPTQPHEGDTKWPTT